MELIGQSLEPFDTRFKLKYVPSLSGLKGTAVSVLLKLR